MVSDGRAVPRTIRIVPLYSLATDPDTPGELLTYLAGRPDQLLLDVPMASNPSLPPQALAALVERAPEPTRTRLLVAALRSGRPAEQVAATTGHAAWDKALTGAPSSDRDWAWMSDATDLAALVHAHPTEHTCAAVLNSRHITPELAVEVSLRMVTDPDVGLTTGVARSVHIVREHWGQQAAQAHLDALGRARPAGLSGRMRALTDVRPHRHHQIEWFRATTVPTAVDYLRQAATAHLWVEALGLVVDHDGVLAQAAATHALDDLLVGQALLDSPTTPASVLPAAAERVGLGRLTRERAERLGSRAPVEWAVNALHACEGADALYIADGLGGRPLDPAQLRATLEWFSTTWFSAGRARSLGLALLTHPQASGADRQAALPFAREFGRARTARRRPFLLAYRRWVSTLAEAPPTTPAAVRAAARAMPVRALPWIRGCSPSVEQIRRQALTLLRQVATGADGAAALVAVAEGFSGTVGDLVDTVHAVTA